MNPTLFQLQQILPPVVGDSEEEVPCTSLPCQWMAHKKQKDNTICMAEDTFEKHDYGKTVKKVKHVEDFDSRPLEFRGTVAHRLP